MAKISGEFKRRLESNDDAAWRELERDFGRFIVAGIRGAEGPEFSPPTVEDLRQEVLSQLLGSIGKFETERGTSFTSWLYAFGQHAASNYRSKNGAVKRGGGKEAGSLGDKDIHDGDSPEEFADFERKLFRAKVMRALRKVEAEALFEDFQAYYLRISSGMDGGAVALALGVSPATVSRMQQRVRRMIRSQLAITAAEFSWSESEAGEFPARGLTRQDDAAFDQALSLVLDLPE